MEYFNMQEQEIMASEFREFDEKLIHEKYKEISERSLRFKTSTDLVKLKCTICNYIYDPASGDPEHGIQPGTQFSDLPAEWKCPVCLARKEAFREII
jgi:rubredoxin